MTAGSIGPVITTILPFLGSISGAPRYFSGRSPRDASRRSQGLPMEEIMSKRARAAKAPAKVESPKLDLNAASVVHLMNVKGIGQGRAESIVRHRDKNGP